MGLFFRKKDTAKRNENGFLEIEVKPLLEWDEPNGEGCIVSDRITRDGWKVGYMIREEPLEAQPDSGWRFFQGIEDSAYSSDPNNHHIFALNTICNYDPDILPYLHAPIGTALIRSENGTFIEDDGTKPVFIEKQNRSDLNE